ncbi:MAG: ABC transporter permease [Clostridium sp.]|uniref:ABC transporter permease n=1 Tax=Clostridium sp. TaxID=1506 RepID=UPI003F2B9EF8
MEILISVLEQASLFSLAAIGVYITYKLLDFPDLSVDGSYPLGAAITAVLLVNGVNPIIAIFCSIIGGAISGYITAILHVKFKITNLMSGILVMISLYSINLLIMGKSNIPLLSVNHIFMNKKYTFFIILFILILLKLMFDLFMKTKLGFLLTAVGDNEQMVTSLGVSANKIKILGLVLSNSLVALSGSLITQYQGFADVGMGTGIVVKGLACVIIGMSLFKNLKFIKATTFSILGTIIYYSAIQLALKVQLDPNYLKLLTAILIIIALSIDNIPKRKKNLMKKEEEIEC